MKITLILARDRGEEKPWIIGAWDEWAMDYNDHGFREQLEKDIASHDEVKTAVVEIPDGFLESVFNQPPPSTKGVPVNGGSQ